MPRVDKPMRVLVACEFSGVVRNEFLKRGHDAWSCDLRAGWAPTRGRHLQQDVRPLLEQRWDLVIAHPPCTYLCNSGVCWLHTRRGRWEKMEAGCLFFLQCLNANAPRVCVENPVMHGYARGLIGVPPTQRIQPYWFGDAESKATLLWLTGLPPLEPTNVLENYRHSIWKMGGGHGVQRSITFTGIARAMAAQWSPDLS